MKKIQIGGAGGAPANNFIRSLQESNREYYIVGTSCIASDLFLADVDERYVVPPALSADYSEKILKLLAKIRPDFLHLQNDYEVRAISRLRDQVEAIGTKLYLPKAETVENCVDKQKSYIIWKEAGLPVPETLMLRDENDLKRAFEQLGNRTVIKGSAEANGAFLRGRGSAICVSIHTNIQRVINQSLC